ncbi:putative ATP-dependent RNA helicase DDX56 isoform X2 [Arctopsyche grandis]|uniref:putative ATP-dependent RNA helicase DDX56 isoform X2 n=1 Tax=Arctopsyche grandis TaxID=121162 RepID=UPI00406D84D1
MGSEPQDPPELNFHEMELDDRLLKAIAKLGWLSPTLVQERAIPLLLEGKDVLLRARTGSGKTAAFSIPVIQKILNSKQTDAQQSIKALILAPSKELCTQICSAIVSLTVKCAREVRCVDLSADGEIQLYKPLLLEKPDIVVATPSKALAHLKANNMKLKSSLDVLVIDEADLVFSFGYEEEVKNLLNYMPSVYQSVLASATLSDDVQNLKKIVLRNPVILKLEEPELAPITQLEHYHVKAEENDKAAILYALLKLNLVRGKTIIFVRTVDRCYKLKLYLEQFKIPACVLNSELPAAVRCLAVSQFNKDVYQIIVASDEKALEEPEGESKDSKNKKKLTSKRIKDKESGVSRGIDFQRVSNVINFDFPPDVSSYVHRAGRTARGNDQGQVLSFVSMRENPLLDEVEESLSKGYNMENVLKTYEFCLEQVEGFRYRSRDAWRAVTRIAVREARLKEIKQELLNCKKLKAFFDDNPQELLALRHDKALHTVKIQQHLSDVPEYIIPEALKQIKGIGNTTSTSNPLKRKRTRFSSSKSLKYKARQKNPLQNLNLKKLREDSKRQKVEET